MNFNPSRKTRRIMGIVLTCSDWLLLAVGEGVTSFVSKRTPRGQRFSVLDPSISFPEASHDTVSLQLLIALSLGVPMGIVLFASLLLGPGKIIRRAKVLNWSLLGIATAIVATQLFTDLTKFIVGRPRPDFLSRCQPDATKAQAAFTATAVALFNTSICNTTNISDLNEGYRSFPSGHASMSFAGLTFLSLWLAGILRFFVPGSTHGKHVYAYAISLVPLLLAMFITATRVSDFRHRLSDVVGGALIGIFCAVVAYRLYFPWLSLPEAGTPWMVLNEMGDGDTVNKDLPLLPVAQGQDLERGENARLVSTSDDGRVANLA